jgi:hypothetical protein
MEAQRGIRTLNRGDLTGARAVTATEAAKERASVIARTTSELNDPDTQIELVPIPGRASAYALPTYVVQAIRKSAR